MSILSEKEFFFNIKGTRDVINTDSHWDFFSHSKISETLKVCTSINLKISFFCKKYDAVIFITYYLMQLELKVFSKAFSLSITLHLKTNGYCLILLDYFDFVYFFSRQIKLNLKKIHIALKISKILISRHKW